MAETPTTQLPNNSKKGTLPAAAATGILEDAKKTNSDEAKKGLEMIELLSGQFIESKVQEIVNKKLSAVDEKLASLGFLEQFFVLEDL